MNHLEIIAKQGRHSMYNVTLRSLLINIFAVESNKYYIFSVCVCSLSYPACKARAPYCRLWLVGLYNTFPLYHLTGTIRKESLKLKNIYISLFSLKFFWNICHSKKKWAARDQNFILVLKSNAHYSCQILTKLEISRPIFEKYSNIKFHEYLSNGNCSMRTDRHDEANSRFSKFCERT